MATVPQPNPSKKSAQPVATRSDWDACPLKKPLQAVGLWPVFRFLSSLKLAVLSLSSMASVLSYATFHESYYGTQAVKYDIYEAWWFAAIMGFLGTNILCAALIRIPWKRRQTGFVITHAGLLVVLIGSALMMRLADEGLVALSEGDQGSEVVRTDHAIIRLAKLDPTTGEPEGLERELSFSPGPRPWPGDRTERLTDEGDRLQVRILKHYPESDATYLHEPVESGGVPMVEIRPFIKTPNQIRESDVFERDFERWFVAHDYYLDPVSRQIRSARSRTNRFQRAIEEIGPVQIAFQYADDPRMVDDFLIGPTRPGSAGNARIHYIDREGRHRVYECLIDNSTTIATVLTFQEVETGAHRVDQVVVGRDDPEPVLLPDSDLTVQFNSQAQIDTSRMTSSDDERDQASSQIFALQSGRTALDIVTFTVRRGDDDEGVTHIAWDSLLMAPQVIAEGGSELVRIAYDHPSIGYRSQRRALVEILGTRGGKLYFRAINRDGLVASGPVEPGRRLSVLDAAAGQMSMSMEVGEYLPSGREQFAYKAISLPKSQRGNGLAAALVELTVGNESKQVWIRRPATFDPRYETVSMANGDYQVAYDCRRRELDFTLKLNDFEVGFDPGTKSPSKFVSDVTLIDGQTPPSDHVIRMNQPLEHRFWTFYQSSYIPEQDEMGNKTGSYQSVFQVRYDPVWPVIYGGCLLVVLGTFVQFYMRAGIFTPGTRDHAKHLVTKVVPVAEGSATPKDTTDLL